MQQFPISSPRSKPHVDGLHSRARNSPNSGGQVMSPDYWLKGYGRNSTPTQAPFRQSSPHIKQQRNRTPAADFPRK